VRLRADPGLSTLLDFRYRQHFRAGRGEHGSGNNRTGADGEDVVIPVPVGTVVRDAETGELLGDLVEPGQELVVARGGRGGWGNARFASPRNRAPRRAEPGQPGEARWLRLELKLLADAGLVGMPNAGKSSILARVSAARPKVADYPFTTLEPCLGVVAVPGGSSFVLADIPGLIEGAHAGKGLGHRFLRHVERTRVLVHVLDLGAPAERDLYHDYVTINRELERYQPDLSSRPQVVVANKVDLPGARERLHELRTRLPGVTVRGVSALTGEGIPEMIGEVARLLARERWS
jgi:GTP-binding protein